MDNIPDIVDFVLYFLAGLSILTWTILIVKAYVFWRQKRANINFISHYTDVTRLTKLPEALYKAKGSLSYLSNKAMLNLKAWGKDISLDANVYSDMLKQSLREERHRQQVRLESGLAVLASISAFC